VANAKRIKTKYMRMKFVGQPKLFQDIIALLANFSQFSLKSTDRLAGLEELYIFGNYSDKNKDALRN
jgi:hypothetical protein